MCKRTGWKNPGRALALLLSLMMALACLPQPAAARAEAESAWREEIPAMLNAAPYREGIVIAGFRGVTADELSGLFPEEPVVITPLFEAAGTDELVAEVTSGEWTTEEILLRLAEIPSVLYAEPDYLTEPAEDGGNSRDSGDGSASDADLTPYEYMPNLASRQWGFSDAASVRDNTVGSKEPVSSVHAFPDLSGTGSNMDRAVYCAVLDGFADYNNPDLTDVIVHFTNEEQKALGCGEWGYNASTYGSAGQTAEDFLPDTHGTHCAGLLGASWDGKGISGAASNAKIVAVQVSDPFEGGTIQMSGVLRGFDFVNTYNSYYAARNPEKVIRIVSMSIAVPFTTRALNAVIYELGEKFGTLTFIASGNEGMNNDTSIYNCGSLRQNPYAFVVASSDQSGRMSSFSNYGVNTVALAAPGSSMLSTMPVSTAAYFPGLFTDADSPYADVFTETFDHYDPDYTDGRVRISQVPYGSDNPEKENPAKTVREDLRWTGEHSLILDIDHSLTVPDEEEEDGTTYDLASFRVEIPLTYDEAEKISSAGADSGIPEYQIGLVFGGYAEYHYSEAFFVNLKGQSSENAIVLELARQDPAQVWSVLATGETEASIDSLSQIVPDMIPDEGITLVCNFTLRVPKSGDVIAFDCVAIGNSCVPYTIYDGTSMAAPVAAGTAAVYASRHPEENGAQLAARIRASVTTGEQSLKGKLVTEGRIDLKNDRAGTWVMPGQVQPSWSLYENTLPLDTQTGQPFRYGDSLGDMETFGPLVELDDRLWYLPAFLGDMSKTRKELYIYREIRCFDTETNTWNSSLATSIPGSPLWGASACAWNGKLWIYGMETEQIMPGHFCYNESKAQTPHIYSFDPQSRTWSEHSVSNIRVPGAVTLFANDDGLMIFDNGTNGVQSDGEDAPESSLISAYDPQSGLGSLITKITEPDEFILDVSISSRGKVSWIVETYSTSGMLFRLENGKVERIRVEFPEHLEERNPDYYGKKILRHLAQAVYYDYMQMVAGDEALYFVGWMDKDKKADTWVLPYGSTALKPYEKHLSVSRPIATTAAFSGGKIYAIAADWGENDARVFRSTRVEGEEPTPSPSPSPTPAPTPKPVPKTGDSAHPELWLLMTVIPLLVITYSVNTGRKKSKRAGK